MLSAVGLMENITSESAQTQSEAGPLPWRGGPISTSAPSGAVLSRMMVRWRGAEMPESLGAAAAPWLTTRPS